MMTEDEKPRQLPERFRASTDPNDPGYALLQANDAKQAELAAKVHSPFGGATPREIMRVKARVTIDALKHLLAPNKRLAENFALIGDYEAASHYDPDNAVLYQKYYDAVWTDGWCEHPVELHGYISEYIFSVRDGREESVTKCNVCGYMDCNPAPDHLKVRAQTEAKIRSETKGMSMDEVKRHLQQNYPIR